MTSKGYEDEYGIVAPLPTDTNIRRLPPADFPTGPAVGTRLPDFELRDHSGRLVRLHHDRGNAKAAVMFFRSAVW